MTITYTHPIDFDFKTADRVSFAKVIKDIESGKKIDLIKSHIFNIIGEVGLDSEIMTERACKFIMFAAKSKRHDLLSLLLDEYAEHLLPGKAAVMFGIAGFAYDFINELMSKQNNYFDSVIGSSIKLAAILKTAIMSNDENAIKMVLNNTWIFDKIDDLDFDMVLTTMYHGGESSNHKIVENTPILIKEIPHFANKLFDHLVSDDSLKPVLLKYFKNAEMFIF